MTSAMHRTPIPLKPQELDDFLHRGWYRVGAALIASRYYLHDGELYSTIWTRTPLVDWALRPGQKRRIARMARRFAIDVVPFVYTPEHESLYARYLTVAPGQRSESLLEFLGGVDGVGLFETRAIEFRDAGKLVGFSLFDVGATTLQSLTGVYDPNYRRYGIGAHSMLLEAHFGKQGGFAWHYAGYVVPGVPMMDYKWALSEDMEFLHPEHGDWVHRRHFPALETPDKRVKRRLRQAATALARQQVPVGWRLNELFSAPHLHEPLARCLAEPLVLVLPGTRQGQPLMTWNDEAQEFRLLRGLPVEVQRTFPGEPDVIHTDRTWLIEETLGAGLDPEPLALSARGLIRP